MNLDDLIARRIQLLNEEDPAVRAANQLVINGMQYGLQAVVGEIQMLYEDRFDKPDDALATLEYRIERAYGEASA